MRIRILLLPVCLTFVVASSCQGDSAGQNGEGYLTRETIVKAVSSWVSAEIPIHMGVRPEGVRSCAAELLTRDGNAERVVVELTLRSPVLPDHLLVAAWDASVIDGPGMRFLAVGSSFRRDRSCQLLYRDRAELLHLGSPADSSEFALRLLQASFLVVMTDNECAPVERGLITSGADLITAARAMRDGMPVHRLDEAAAFGYNTGMWYPGWARTSADDAAATVELNLHPPRVYQADSVAGVELLVFGLSGPSQGWRPPPRGYDLVKYRVSFAHGRFVGLDKRVMYSWSAAGGPRAWLDSLGVGR